MNIIFLGTPEFSVTSLEKLLESKHKVLAVVTQPDAEAGRGHKLVPPPIKKFAESRGLKVFQFQKIGRDGIEALSALKPDIMVTAAYGQILTKKILDIPRLGTINVHASLLPKYRGASPIQSAIIKGEKVTGVTIMQTDIGLDNGDILATKEVNINPAETAGELAERLAVIGAELLVETLDKIENNTATKVPQNHSDATFTTKITKNDCVINFEKSAEQIKNLVLGANPDPIAYTKLNNNVVKIYRAAVSDKPADQNAKNGQILACSSAKNGVFVKCGTGVLEILEAQLPGGKVLTAKQLFSGRKFNVGDQFIFDVDL